VTPSPKRKLIPEKLQWTKYLLAGMGVPVALSIALVNAQPSREDILKRQVEQAFGLPRNLMEQEERIDEVAEKKRTITEAQWQTNFQVYQTGNKSGKALALATLAFLRSNNPHPKESIELAKDYIRTNKIEDWHTAIRLLRYLNDPGWSTYNQQGLSSPDAAVRQAYEFFDANVLRISVGGGKIQP